MLQIKVILGIIVFLNFCASLLKQIDIELTVEYYTQKLTGEERERKDLTVVRKTLMIIRSIIVTLIFYLLMIWPT